MPTPLSVWARAKLMQQANRDTNPAPQKPQAPARNTAPAPPKPFEPPPVRERDTGDAGNDVRAIPDAWRRPFRTTAKPKEEQAETTEYARPPGRPRLDPAKRRRNTISIALSEEEEEVMRRAAGNSGLSLSEWIRNAVFSHMNAEKGQTKKNEVKRPGGKLRDRR